jgi:TRAP-type mannitol/chloroaromatic compound transport system substrate-binding protein
MKTAMNVARVLLFSMVVVALSTLFISTASAADLPTLNWRLQCAFPPGDHEADIAVPERIKYIEEKTGGKFKIKRFYAGEIMPPEEMIRGVGQGLAEMGEGCANYWVGVDKLFDLSFGLPGTNRGPVGDVWAFQNGSEWSFMLSNLFAKHGLQYIGWHDYGPYPIFCSRVPVRKLADWKGKKVRAAGYVSEMLKALGATTVYFPAAELAQSLTTGVVDIACWSAEGIKDMGLGAVMDYLILPPFIEHIGGALFANQKAWDTLPDAYKQVIRDAEVIAHLHAVKFWDKYMEDNVKLATGVGKGPFGYEVIRLPANDVAAMNKLAETTLLAQWAKNSPSCARGIEFVKDWYSSGR